MRIREIVVLRGAVNSEEALRAVLPSPWSVIYVQDLLGAAVCEADGPEETSPEELRASLARALAEARALPRAA
jgi:hypothetical protein